MLSPIGFRVLQSQMILGLELKKFILYGYLELKYNLFDGNIKCIVTQFAMETLQKHFKLQ